MEYLPEQIVNWMEEAVQLAEEARARDEVPVGALLIQSGNVIGRGMNLRETHHRTVSHAEVVALEDYGTRTGQWRVPLETTLIVTVEPCLMCTGALLWSRVTHIFYGCKDTRGAGLLRVQPLIEKGVYDHRFKTIQGEVLSEKCSKMLSDYFKAKR